MAPSVQAPRAPEEQDGTWQDAKEIWKYTTPRKNRMAALRKAYPWLFTKPKPKKEKVSEDEKTVQPRDPNATNIILVVVDTERADYTNPFGAKHQTTPFMAQMAREGIAFTKAFSPAPWTVPAMFSMMTGVYPKEHGIVRGVRHNEGLEAKGQQVLPKSAVTLAERLKDMGYSTFGVNTNYHLIPQFGFNQGFDHFLGNDFAFLPFPNLALNSLLPMIRKASKYFLWIHYLDPHYPYIPRSPWFGEYNTSPFTSYNDVAQSIVLKFYRDRTGIAKSDPVAKQDIISLHRLVKQTARSTMLIRAALTYYIKPKTDDAFARFLKAIYLSEIRNTDKAIKDALSTLEVDDNSIVIITSDHGEELFDHGQFGHRTSAIYQELLHVPLVIRLPNRKYAGRVVNTPVTTIDIVPTLLELLGQPVPEEFSGISLIPLIKGKKVPPRPLYAEVDDPTGETRVLFEYPWKLIYRHNGNISELYNLASDPGEKTDLANTETSRTEAMRERLVEWVDKTKLRWDVTMAPPLSQAELRKLSLMGYVQ
ncbi:MAG: sulfatase-like hydrolase/transferase [Proteobacteria bacterium]|nr:sulfatase-like hydrolase/transferase [Pseudomonadota bacterium]